MKNPPDRIFLQWHGDADANLYRGEEPGEVTWSSERIFHSDIQYVMCKKKRFACTPPPPSANAMLGEN